MTFAARDAAKFIIFCSAALTSTGWVQSTIKLFNTLTLQC